MKNWTQPAIAASIGELFIIFALIFFPPVYLSPGPKNYEQTKTESNRSTDKKDPTASDVSLPFRLGEFIEGHNGAIGAIGTLVTAFLTIYLTIYNGQMVRTIRLQREDAQGVSERQANETQQQIAIAKDAADTAKQNLISSQRAWIRIDEVGFATSTFVVEDTGAGGGIFLKVSNVGNDPALHVECNARMVGPEDSPIKRQLEYADLIKKNAFAMGFTLFPGERFPKERVPSLGWVSAVTMTGDGIKQQSKTSKLARSLSLSLDLLIIRFQQTGALITRLGSPSK